MGWGERWDIGACLRLYGVIDGLLFVWCVCIFGNLKLEELTSIRFLCTYAESQARKNCERTAGIGVRINRSRHKAYIHQSKAVHLNAEPDVTTVKRGSMGARGPT